MDKKVFWKVALFILEDFSSLRDKSSGGYCIQCYSKEVISSRFRMICKNCGSITAMWTYRETVIAKILETEEGREALAKSMVEPIKQSIVEYPPHGNPAYYPQEELS